MDRIVLWMGVFFFFNQKTAYEMRISDWSSDVCSSDLILLGAHRRLGGMLGLFAQQRFAVFLRDLVIVGVDFAEGQEAVTVAAIFDERRLQRSEESRVGKECVSKSRSRWSPYH